MDVPGFMTLDETTCGDENSYALFPLLLSHHRGHSRNLDCWVTVKSAYKTREEPVSWSRCRSSAYGDTQAPG